MSFKNIISLVIALVTFSIPACAQTTRNLENIPAALFQVVRIDLSAQTVQVSDNSGIRFESPISSGRPWMPTPTGTNISIGTEQDPVKVKVRDSKQFGGNMHWCIPLNYHKTGKEYQGNFMHQGNLYDPGTPAAYPASHGCIRLPEGKAEEFFDLIQPYANVVIVGNAMDYFRKNFAGAKLLKFSEDGTKLLGWKWNPQNGPDGDFVELATALQQGKLKGSIYKLRRDGTFTGKVEDIMLGFEFFGGPKDSPNVWDLGIPATVYNKAVEAHNAKGKAPRLMQIIPFTKRA